MNKDERWIENWEGYYSVSENGEVFSYRNGAKKALKGSRGVYRTVSFWLDGFKGTEYVHRLVAKAFLPNPENKLEVNHIDADKYNNNVKNLEWCNRKENIDHAWRTGRSSGKHLELSDETKKERTLEFYNGCMTNNTHFYKKFVDVDFLIAKGLPVECMSFAIPLKRFKNILSYWEFTVCLFSDILEGLKVRDIAAKYGMDETVVSKIKSRKMRVKEWKAYDSRNNR